MSRVILAESKDIGKRIRYFRDTIGLKGKEFAEKLAISSGYLSEIEHGKKLPSESILLLVSLVFNVNKDWLRAGEGPMERDELGELGQVVRKDEIPLIMITSYIKSLWRESDEKRRGWFEIEFERHFPEYKDWAEKKQREKAAQDAGIPEADLDKKTA